jgi:hypothetical protein
MVIKTIISAEHTMFPLVRSNLASRNCGYELFGFDVLLDADLKPWLIEVNISPSLHSSSPLDLEVKSPLATEVFNIVRYHVPNKISAKSEKQILKKLNMEDVSQLCFDPRLYTHDLSKADRAKQIRICAMASDRDRYLVAALERLTPDDVRCLIRAEDEMAQLTRFARIFPAHDTHERYAKFFQQPRYYNLLIDAWEHKYGDCRHAGIDRLEQLCQEKVHLKVATASSVNTKPTKRTAAVVDVSRLKGPTGLEPGEKTAQVCCDDTNSLPVTTEQKEAATSKSPPLPPSLIPKSTKASPKGVVAKPLHLKPNQGCPGGGGGRRKTYKSSKHPSTLVPSTISTASATATTSDSCSSPEPMSLGDGDKSRTPSPSAANAVEVEENDNENSEEISSSSLTTSSKTTTPLILDNRPSPSAAGDVSAAAVATAALAQ